MAWGHLPCTLTSRVVHTGVAENKDLAKGDVTTYQDICRRFQSLLLYYLCTMDIHHTLTTYCAPPSATHWLLL